ncbi:MAG: succinyl-diaminopimelate desuccinylase [Actinobacteria bacterium]|nr:succinyl-diaminopimelate desuccinylase [Actinomycetota bacterium]
MPDLATRLAARTLELVDIPSESRHEERVRRHLRELVPPAFAPVYEAEDAFLWIRPRRPDVPLVLLVGHYDTVPAQENVPGRIDGGAVHGCGASDMKGGVAVAIELLRDLAEDRPGALDIGLLLFGKEELPPQWSPLPHLFETSSDVLDAALAVLLEPTDLEIHAGCLGNLNASVTFSGVSGHSARPWTAENAIEKALEGLRSLAAIEPRDAVVGGLVFREVVSITRLSAGIADNVIPDSAVATLNVRYAPDRSPEDAEEWVRELVPADAELTIESNSPSARVVTDTPLVEALRDAGDLLFEPKQAWTNVADFTSRGIDAVNFGPGGTRYAHRRDELVEIDALIKAYEVLHRFLLGESRA